MTVLLDHNLPKRLSTILVGHEVKTTRQMRWEGLENGVLLQTAASAGFHAFLTIDKNLEHEQNLSKLALPVVVIDSDSNALPAPAPVCATPTEIAGTAAGFAPLCAVC
jgi:hypothetical protein